MYQALYRKWRPKTFADVVGQDHVTATLRRQVGEGRTSHAYLFTGTRGTGKTTCAKILAKAVNCENPRGGEPCNECPACRGIDAGALLDVTELDAASNNGVENVRALRDEAVYAPARLAKRVYIVDEVHMLSVSAFNALLKILEEPPTHLMFILATTELYKVPATILSRCQRFSFRRLLPRDIEARLLEVARAEQLALTPDGAELLARLSDGALRDALSLLDQCAAAGGTIDAAGVLETLGLAGGVHTARLMEYILRRDARGALLFFGEMYAGGKDAGAALGELAGLARDLLIDQTAGEGGAALLTGGYDPTTIRTLREGCSPARLLYLNTTLQSARTDLTQSANQRTDVELCLLRLCDEGLAAGRLAADRLAADTLDTGTLDAGRLDADRPTAGWPTADGLAADRLAALTARVERLEEQINALRAAEPPTAAPLLTPAPVSQDEPVSSDEPAPPDTAVSADEPESGEYERLTARFLERLPMGRGSFFKMAQIRVEGDLLKVYCCGEDLVRQNLEPAEVRRIMGEIASDTLGRPVRAVVLPGSPEEGGDRMQDLIQAGQKLDHFKII